VCAAILLLLLLRQAPSTPVEVRLSLDRFEKAINMLELMHFDAVKAWWEEQQSGELHGCIVTSHWPSAACLHASSGTAACHIMSSCAAFLHLVVVACSHACDCCTVGAGPSTSAPQIPEIPAMKRLLPRAVALEALAPLVPDSKLALQLLEYWLRRRQQEGGPLLARIWFEQPWKVRGRRPA
jgi:hypothetical protein